MLPVLRASQLPNFLAPQLPGSPTSLPPSVPCEMTFIWWLVILLGAAITLFVVFGVWLAAVLKWEDEQTVGLNYYGLPPQERDAFKTRLRNHARWLGPFIALNARLGRLDFRKARIQYKGVSAPAQSCSNESFEKAHNYQPQQDDVFVVTQMKCGTTWMQQVVYEILHRGRGDLVESGRTMYAISPWIEGRKSVPIEQSKPVGLDVRRRIIKTHLPEALLPFSDDAKYIYVARHPVSCFASCVDFVYTNAGSMSPELPAFVEWFTSRDLMWWGTWTDHVKGWWHKAQASSNVLFVFFEDMKRDLEGVVRQVAAFIGVNDLSDAEVAEVVRKAGFLYMQEHQDNFEMHPPHLLQTNAELFVSGRSDRYKKLPVGVRESVSRWVVEEMDSSAFPLREHYPDLFGQVDSPRSAPGRV